MPFKVGQFLANPLNFLEYPNSMFLAVVEALKTETFPNPKVGAVLIDKNNKLKASGHHKGKGTNHAEIEILNNSNVESTDTLFVTLEPCFHTDTSPSCADEILKTDIKNIVIGDIDHDIRTCGKSIEKLKTNLEIFHSTLKEKYKEQSIDDFCQFLIETGKKVYSHEVDDFLCLGTPDEFRTYEYWLESNEISNIK